MVNNVTYSFNPLKPRISQIFFMWKQKYCRNAFLITHYYGRTFIFVSTILTKKLSSSALFWTPLTSFFFFFLFYITFVCFFFSSDCSTSSVTLSSFLVCISSSLFSLNILSLYPYKLWIVYAN